MHGYNLILLATQLALIDLCGLVLHALGKSTTKQNLVSDQSRATASKRSTKRGYMSQTKLPHIVRWPTTHSPQCE